MKDLIAALQSLTLPWDAISGTRIVLDGVNGRILIYNAADELIASISPTLGTDDYGNTVQLGMAVYDTSLSPPAYVQLERSNVWVVAGDDSHYVQASAGASIASVQVVDNVTDSNALTSVDSLGVPYNRWEYRSGGGANVDYMQVESQLTYGEISYSPSGVNFSLFQRFLKGLGIRWFSANPVPGTTRGFFWDQSDGYIKSQTRSGAGVITTETWQNLPLQGGWASAGTDIAQYRLDADGSVYIRGRIAGGAAPGAFATLPAGYRPGEVHGVGTINPATLSNQQVIVTTAGVMSIFNVGASNWIDLGGIAPFKVAGLP